MDISTLSLPELKRLLSLVPKEIERRQKEEKTRFLNEMEARAAELGFDLDELIGEAGKKQRASVAAKFRHPDHPELTWSGRGRQPRWVGKFLDEGGTLEQLKI